MPEAEKYRVKNVSIKNLLNPDFIKKIQSKKEFDIDATHILLFNLQKKDKKININPIVISHQSSEELKKNIVHVECPNNDILSFVIKVLKDMGVK